MKQGEFEYALQPGESLLLIARRFRVTLNQLLSANPQYRADPAYVRGGDTLLIPAANVQDTLVRLENVTLSDNPEACCEYEPDTDWLQPGAGLLTFRACGSEARGRRFSRKPHVPDANSGVVIGRGYRLKDRSEQQIVSDLLEACVDARDAQSLASCRHLTGSKARKFIQDMGFNRIEITQQSQYRLFKILYSELVGAIQSICRRLDVEYKFGPVNWGELSQSIKDVVVDLHYCGDYTSATRERLQPALVSGKEEDFVHILSDQYYWLELRNVTLERYELRKQHLAPEPSGLRSKETA